MAKREGFRDSQYFFDVQRSRGEIKGQVIQMTFVLTETIPGVVFDELISDALRLDGMKRWPGSGNNYTFHCWVRLVAENTSSSSEERLRRRYLYRFVQRTQLFA